MLQWPPNFSEASENPGISDFLPFFTIFSCFVVASTWVIVAVFKIDGVGNSLIRKGNIGVTFLDPNTSSGAFVGEEHNAAIRTIGTINAACAVGWLAGVGVGVGAGVVVGMGCEFFVHHALHFAEHGLVVHLVGLREAGKDDLGRKRSTRVAVVGHSCIVDHQFNHPREVGDLILEGRNGGLVGRNGGSGCCKFMFGGCFHMVDDTGLFEFLLVGVVSACILDKIGLKFRKRFGSLGVFCLLPVGDMILHPWNLIEVNNSFDNNSIISDWNPSLLDFLLAFLLAAKILLRGQISHGAAE